LYLTDKQSNHARLQGKKNEITLDN